VNKGAAAVGPAWPALRRRIRQRGPLRFSAWVEGCLYGAGGFYGGGGGAGRRGADFLTSPEVGPLFGEALARAIDGWWVRAGRPDPWVVVEAGAGRGSLARAVLDARPECGRAMRYVAVERSATLRQAAALSLSAHPAAQVAARPPSGRIRGVVLANELLDNLAFDLIERTCAGWAEVRVGEDEAGRPLEVLVDLTRDVPLHSLGDRLAPDAAPGTQAPVQTEAGRWLRKALSLLQAGAVLCVDYARETTAELTTRPTSEWLRTYRAHGRGAPPIENPGLQDITCDVAIDQLALVARPSCVTTQAEWLRALGIEGLAAGPPLGERVRRGPAASPALDDLRRRNRRSEASALTDPTGLGGFTVLIWERL